MALNTGKKNVRRSWNVIPIPDIMITRVNALVSDQPEQLIFNDIRGRPMGDVKIPGVDASDIDVKNIEIPGVHVDIQEPQLIEIIDPDISPTDPDPIEPARVHQEDASVELMPAIQKVEP